MYILCLKVIISVRQTFINPIQIEQKGVKAIGKNQIYANIPHNIDHERKFEPLDDLAFDDDDDKDSNETIYYYDDDDKDSNETIYYYDDDGEEEEEEEDDEQHDYSQRLPMARNDVGQFPILKGFNRNNEAQLPISMGFNGTGADDGDDTFTNSTEADDYLSNFSPDYNIRPGAENAFFPPFNNGPEADYPFFPADNNGTGVDDAFFFPPDNNNATEADDAIFFPENMNATEADDDEYYTPKQNMQEPPMDMKLLRGPHERTNHWE